MQESSRPSRVAGKCTIRRYARAGTDFGTAGSPSSSAPQKAVANGQPANVNERAVGRARIAGCFSPGRERKPLRETVRAEAVPPVNHLSNLLGVAAVPDDAAAGGCTGANWMSRR